MLLKQTSEQSPISSIHNGIDFQLGYIARMEGQSLVEPIIRSITHWWIWKEDLQIRPIYS